MTEEQQPSSLLGFGKCSPKPTSIHYPKVSLSFAAQRAKQTKKTDDSKQQPSSLLEFKNLSARSSCEIVSTVFHHCGEVPLSVVSYLFIHAVWTHVDQN